MKLSLAGGRRLAHDRVRLRPKTEEFLYFLLWSAEQLTQPTFRNLEGSFESWAYCNGLSKQLARLEARKFLERKNGGGDARVYRLTSQGLTLALGGRNPEVEWSRAWDGRWRLVLFDVPLGQNAKRSRLRRYLRDRRFGFLQNSVWITPDSLAEEVKVMQGAKIDVEALILFEGRPCAGESDAEIVGGAWDFVRLGRLYQKYLRVLAEKPSGKLQDRARADSLRRWAAAERTAWHKAVSRDPLLPEGLLPSGYLGKRAWRERSRVLGKAWRDVTTFDHGMVRPNS